MIDTSHWDDQIDELLNKVHTLRQERAHAKRNEYTFTPQRNPTPPRPPRTTEDTLEAYRGAWRVYQRMGRPERAQAVQRRAERIHAA